ncbi:hypothetical protein NERG_01768 [Nematocida ausubeli]|uniref:Uncharacterized protein n=1 Tax=Nematocida ausubeli (strain ATCC PRA-371 / ERTm2) TaxID=1913371 RepID=H8ZDU7_NEMA1|nr:hypothetical protein NERG_01768 [Nematocida ausubeli]
MKVICLVMLILASVARCYLEQEMSENRFLTTVPLKTFFFMRRLSPYSSKLDRPLPMGAHKRIDSEEKFSPFHSVFVIRKQKSLGEPIHSLSERLEHGRAERMESAESFIKDFLVSHMQHLNSFERPNQFNTEKIYNDIYNKKNYPGHRHSKRPALPSKEILGDEIDAIIANAAKEITPNLEENENENASFKKSIRRTRRDVGKKLKNARSTIEKKVKINWLTILIFVIIGVISGFAGYSLRGRTSTEHYVPLEK